MKYREAKQLYKEFKKNATFSRLDFYFDDKKQQLFVKGSPITESRLFNYSNLWWDQWDDKTVTINKGHPYVGAVVGNAIAGFGGGFLGALAGQQAQGKHVRYVTGPTVTLNLRDGEMYTHLLIEGKVNRDSFLGREYQKQIDELQDKFSQVEGRGMN